MITQFMEGNTFVFSLDSPSDLVNSSDWVRPAHNAEVHKLRTQEAMARTDHHYYGAPISEINRVLREGWPEGVEKIRRLVEDMQHKVKAPVNFRRRQTWSEDGDDPSWEREQSGHTEIWRTARRQSQRGPVTVELAAPWSGNAGRTAEQLQWDGVALLTLSEILEGAGYRVGASVNDATSYSDWSKKQYGLYQVVVKEPGQPLDIASAVPIIVYPGAVRWHGINLGSMAPFEIDMGYGRAVELDQIPDVSIFKADAIKLRHCYSESAARAEIERVLAMFE